MNQTKVSTSRVVHESILPNQIHLVCWKSVLAGLVVSLMTFLLLATLGAAVAGFTAEAMINRESGGGSLATGAALWMGVSIIAALFAGSYFALRVSTYVTTKIGIAHGLVIGSVFFLLMLLGIGNILGGLASGFASIGRGAGEGMTSLSSNPMVQDVVNRSFGTTTLKSDPKDVAQGLAVRLMQGNVESAKSYYAYQTGLPEAEVDAKIQELRVQFDAAVKNAGEKAADAVGDTGMTMFVLFLLGLIASMLGGGFGATSNVSKPFSRVETYSPAYAGLRNDRGGMFPYLIGWFLGVPVMVLFLIALLRIVF